MPLPRKTVTPEKRRKYPLLSVAQATCAQSVFGATRSAGLRTLSPARENFASSLTYWTELRRVFECVDYLVL